MARPNPMPSSPPPGFGISEKLDRRERPFTMVQPMPNFCEKCGAEVWPLKGTDVLTCKRGHHQPNLWAA